MINMFCVCIRAPMLFNQGGTRLFGDLFPVVANTTGEVSIKANDTRGRVFIAGAKAFRISVGATLRSLQSIIEVMYTSSQQRKSQVI